VYGKYHNNYRKSLIFLQYSKFVIHTSRSRFSNHACLLLLYVLISKQNISEIIT